MKLGGRAVIIQQDDVDTDVLYPGEYLNVTDVQKMTQYLFEGLDPSLRDELGGDTALVVGANFGAGSSREHAPWALRAFGFRAVLATSFADIFRANALKNELLPVELPADVHAGLVAADPDAEVTVDLDAETLTLPDGRAVGFQVDPFARRMLLEGTDELGFLLAQSDAVAAYEASHPQRVDTTAAAGA